MNKSQSRKRIYNFCMSLLIMALETGIMSYVWVKYYNTELPKAYYFWGNVFITAVYLAVLFIFSQMYGGLKLGSYRMVELALAQGFSTLVTNVLFYAIICLLAYHFPSPLPLLIGMILQIVCISAWILAGTYIYRMLFPPMSVLLVYGGKHKDSFVEKVKTRRHQFTITAQLPDTTDLSEVREQIGKHDAVMLWDLPSAYRSKVFKFCYEQGVAIYVSPKIMDIALKGSLDLDYFDTPLMLTKSSPMEVEQYFFKRLFDVVFSICLLLIASPIMLVTAILVKSHDGGKVLYKQVRATIDNKPFYIYKFRSMIEDAEKDGVARLVIKGDPRITPIGKFIRRTRIDELPQLFNVLKGDMSFVGPRPERPEIIEQYLKVMPEFAYRTKVKAGITGYAQIYGKYNTTPYDKLKLDLYYIENYSLWLDVKLVILTVKTLFKFDSTEGIDQGNTTSMLEEDDDE